MAFRKSIGIRPLTPSRNFFDHDPDVRVAPEEPSARYATIGEFYLHGCGSTAPGTSEQWTRVRDCLVDQVIASMEALDQMAALPAEAS